MILLQIILPAVFVFVVFVTGHFFVSNKGSGLYVAEMNFDPETILDEPVEIDPMTIDPDTGLILPDKYNYLKIENVFSGKILGSDKLFSIEVALLTRQPTIASDLFISALVIPKLPSPSLNLTVSLVDLPWFSSNTVTVVEPFVILNGFKVKTLATAGSVLSGLAFLKP